MSRTSWFRGVVGAPKSSRRLPSRGHRIRPCVEILEDRCLLTTYTVNSLVDTNTGMSNDGTLRYVINQANANHTGTADSPDVIQFSVSGTIDVGSSAGGALPSVASNEVVVLDGTTAPSYAGTPMITLDGTQAGPNANGLTLSGGSSTAKGLDIVNFSGNGIQLDTNGGDRVLSCFLGLTTENVAAGNGGNGIFIDDTANNTIGGTDTGAGNVISGNGGNGILIDGVSSTGNTVAANFIGTNAAGEAALGNGGNGIQITTGTAEHDRRQHPHDYRIHRQADGWKRHLRQWRQRRSHHRRRRVQHT